MNLLTTILLFFYLINSVFTKNNVKSLTESMGQEVIEIGTPIKELPPELDEEPSAENDSDEKITSTTIQSATKKETKITNANNTEIRRKGKDVDKIDGVVQEDDEARIEKELAEIYKDNSDYKADSEETTKEAVTTTSSPSSNGTMDITKSIVRSRNDFKFQPDLNDKAEVERFRTSVDEISCNRKMTQKLEVTTEMKPKSAFKFAVNITLLGLVTSFIALCQ